MSRHEIFLEALDGSKLSLDEKAEAIAERMASIKGQIEIHEAEAKDHGASLDRSWRAKAKHALRMLGIVHQKILRECGKRSRAGKEKESGSYAQQFISVAKRRLQPEVFEGIADEAREESHG